jgi:hypothetical protein
MGGGGQRGHVGVMPSSECNHAVGSQPAVIAQRLPPFPTI